MSPAELASTGSGADNAPLDARLVVATAGCWGVTLLGIWCGSRAAAIAATVAGVAGIAAVAAVLPRRGVKRFSHRLPAGLCPDGAETGEQGCTKRESAGRGNAGRGNAGRGSAARGGRVVVATAAGILLAMCGYGVSAAIHVHSAETNPIRDLYGTWSHAAMTLDGTPRVLHSPGFDGSDRVLVRGSLTSVGDGDRARRARGAIVAFAPAEGWAGKVSGQTVRFRGRFAPPGRRDLTVATVQVGGAPYAAGDPPALQRIAKSVRDDFAAACEHVLTARGAGLLRGLVMGDVSGMQGRVRDQFRATGLTHLTAVSGTHFALVCAMVLVVVRPLGPRPAAVVTGAVLIGYAFLVGASPSVLRAALMGLVGLGALVTGRRKQALPALGGTVLILLAWRPALAVSPGFAMSVLATAALVTVAPWWAERLHLRGWPQPLARTVAIACAAHVATLPVVAAIAGRMSIVAVAANLAAVPVVALVMIPGAIAAVLAPVWQWGAQLFVHCAGPGVWWLLHVAQWCSGVPWAQVPVPGGRAGGFLMVLVEIAVAAWMCSAAFRRCAVLAVIAAESVWLPAHWTGRY